MSTTEQRIHANRINAAFSTGPVTEAGKDVASRNATRHGLLSTRLFLDDESPTEFDALFADLCRCLAPIGTLELTLVERICITLWRQRRLVQAEATELSLSRQARRVAAAVSKHLGLHYGNELGVEDLNNFDPVREKWCRDVLAELETLDSLEIGAIRDNAPLTYEQLCSDAQEDNDPVDKFVREHKGGLPGFIGELALWCREQLTKAANRPQVQALAEQVRAARLVLSEDSLELIARYQSTLDNQLYKGLRALREAQEWRLKLLDATPDSVGADLEPESQAA
jgi:hypothetical protein